jgi:putative transposase
MVRGINRQDIFLDREDHVRYIDTLRVIKGRSGCLVHAYCLMKNHIHLLLRETNEPVGNVMKRIGSSYVRWYNQKYERVGHLFQDRFRSEPVEDDAYFLTVLRYIHQNPVRAGLVSDCAIYPWSSYCEYLTPADHGAAGLTDTNFVLELIGGPQEFRRMHLVLEEGVQPLEYVPSATEAELKALLDQLLGGKPTSGLRSMPVVQRNQILARLTSQPGATYAQVARITGIPAPTVRRSALQARR